tara:strand:- start:1169 stop:1360 length:192 start_codon:yes stop_codon:yes gene_type:complete
LVEVLVLKLVPEVPVVPVVPVVLVPKVVPVVPVPKAVKVKVLVALRVAATRVGANQNPFGLQS